MLNRWKKISSKVVSRNDHWSYIFDEFQIEGGDKGEYHFVHTGGSTMIIPVTASNKLILVNQYRYLNQKESLEFPCGSIQGNISPFENAQKELREETGFAAKELTFIGEFSPYSGVSDEMCSVFLGENLFSSPLPSDVNEELEVCELSTVEIDNHISNGKIWDGMSMAAWALYKNHLNISM